MQQMRCRRLLLPLCVATSAVAVLLTLVDAAAQDVPALELADLELPGLGALLAEQNMLTMPTSTTTFGLAAAAERADLWSNSTASDRSRADHGQMPQHSPARSLAEQDSKKGSASELTESPAALVGVQSPAQPSDSRRTQQRGLHQEPCQRLAELPLPDLFNAVAGPDSCGAASDPDPAGGPVLLMPAIGKAAAASAPRGCGFTSLLVTLFPTVSLSLDN